MEVEGRLALAHEIQCKTWVEGLCEEPEMQLGLKAGMIQFLNRYCYLHQKWS